MKLSFLFGFDNVTKTVCIFMCTWAEVGESDEKWTLCYERYTYVFYQHAA